MPDRVVYNGEVVDAPDVAAALCSRAAQYGDGVFETVRAYGGRLFRFSEHAARLFQGLRLLHIEPVFTESSLLAALTVAMRASGCLDGVLKIIAFREGPTGPDATVGAPASFLVTARPCAGAARSLPDRALRLWTVSTRRNTTSLLTTVKSLNYLENILGRIEARAHGADEALFLNISGNVAEGAATNIFIVSGATLVTPPLSAGILPGITRTAVLQCARQCGVACVERDVTPEELSLADEVFVTNAVIETAPVLSLDGTLVGPGTPGPVTGRLAWEYSRLVDNESFPL